jgi:hypothetical protein
MQVDFHYCCIKCVAVAAGFPEKEAEILAYASQYVDDATEHKPIKISNVPPVAENTVIDGTFDPTCTAHSAIQHLTKALCRDVQRKVYIAFHFLPGAPYTWGQPYDYRVRAGGTIARTLLDNALDTYRNAADDSERTRALIKTGIALHSYADTWSHQRFSGRHSPSDNDIERIRLCVDGAWERLPVWKQVGANILPSIGHAEALNFPDWSHLTWGYEHDATGIEFAPSNTTSFLDAACHIDEALRCVAPQPGQPWKAVAARIKTCLGENTDSIKRKFLRWQEQFPEANLGYDPLLWRQLALAGGPLDWSHFQTAEDFATLNLRALGDEKWFLFHVEAKEQRNQVLGMIRPDLL